MEVPVNIPGKALFSAGNLAAEGERLARVLTPLGFAAAGMALCECRWFHIARSALPGCAHSHPLESSSQRRGALFCLSMLHQERDFAPRKKGRGNIFDLLACELFPRNTAVADIEFVLIIVPFYLTVQKLTPMQARLY